MAGNYEVIARKSAFGDTFNCIFFVSFNRGSMKVLVVGSGGREHALVWCIAKSNKVKKIYCAPGNGGTASLAENIPIEADDISSLADFAGKEKIDLTVVGPEQPLSLGVVDLFEKEGLRIKVILLATKSCICRSLFCIHPKALVESVQK